MRAWRNFRWPALVAAGLGVVRAWVPLAEDLWPDGPVYIGVELAAAAPRNLSADWEAVGREAMDAWNSHLQRVQLVPAPTTGEPFYENRRNEIFFDRQIYSHPFPSGVLAVASSSYDRDHRVETDIVFNTAHNWGVYRGPLTRGTEDVRRVLVHELGHLLGLDHPDENGQTTPAVMNARESNTELPTADDIAGAHALYDHGPGSPPIILRHPAALQAIQGERATLFVEVGGRGPLTYEWLRNGLPFAGENSATLTFPAVALDNDASYSVIVRNEAGNATSTMARLTVRPAVPPSAGPIPNQFLDVGANVTLYANVLQGNPPLRYQWQHNGVAILGATNAQLVLRDVQFSDAGYYTVTISNAAGDSSSDPRAGFVSVEPGLAPQFTQDLQSVAVAPRGSFFLRPEFIGSRPVSYQWHKDGVDIPEATTDVFQVTDFNSSNAGRYTVTLTNSHGQATSGAAVISAYEAAELMITQQPASVTESAGATVNFGVTVTPAAGVTYRWLKDGVPLPETGGRIAGTRTATLTVGSIGRDDMAAYSVEATLGSRAIRSSPARLFLRTEGTATFTRQPATHTLPVGGSVDLNVAMYAPDINQPPAYTYQWFKNGQPVPGQTISAYSFVATATSAGRYTVRATLGGLTVESDPADVEITPTERLISSHPPTQFFMQGSEELRLTNIGWEVVRRRAEREGTTYTFRRGDVALIGTPYASGDALPGTYTLTVTRNGLSETSRPFTLGYIETGTPVITRHPAGGAFNAGSTLRLSVSASSMTVPVTYEWRKDGSFVFSSGSGSEFVKENFGPNDVGRYTVTVRNPAGTTTSQPALVEMGGLQAPIITRPPIGYTVDVGRPVTLSFATRLGEFGYQWLKDGRPIVGAVTGTLSLAGTLADNGVYTVVVTDGTVTATSAPATVRVLPATRAPTILVQPVSATAPAGGDISFSASADGRPLPTRYQWRKNGVDIPGATDTKLRLRNVQTDAAGAYSVVIANEAGAVTSQPATLRVEVSGRLVNLATRAAVGRGTNILIAGFVVGGTEPREMLIRAIGDQLSEFGVAGVLRDPVISVYDANAKLLSSNDDWFRGTEVEKEVLTAAAREAGAFPQRDGARDGAVLLTLPPGSYTAQVTGFFNTQGVALVEVYEVGRPGLGRLINLSSRAVVGTDADILIPGIVVGGQAPRRLLIRAVGPGLSDFGVSGTLADPVMTVFRDSTAIARNDNWNDQADASRIVTAMAAVGAFGLRNGSRDAALLLDLSPGSYTVQVAGVGGTTGIALVEVYEIAP